MNLITKFWNSFTEKPDVWFFYGFLITFTLTIRKILFFYPIDGQFNEYTGIYLYLSDVFLILVLVNWGIALLLSNKYSILSIVKSTISALNKPLYFLPLLFVAWSFVSIIWSHNTNLALFRSLKLLEFFLLYIYLIFKMSKDNPAFLKTTFRIIIILGFIQATIGILQFFLQHSVGLFWLKESLISQDLPGVAKIILNGHKIIRSYGLFPHPNVLGGFLVFSILIILFYKKMFHVKHSYKCHSGLDPESRKNHKDTAILKPSVSTGGKVQNDNVKHNIAWNILEIKIFPIFLFVLFLALILTFSKSAMLGFTIAMVFIYLKQKISVPRETLIKNILIASFVVVLILTLLRPDLFSFFIKSLEERILYLNVSPVRIALQSIAGGRETLKSCGTLIFGVGNGQFVLSLNNLKNLNLELWQYQPVHNVFLLIWSELGIIGLFIFIYWLWKMFHPSTNVPPRYKCSMWNILQGRRGTLYGTSVKQKNKDCHSERSISEAEESNSIRSLDRARDDIRVYLKAILLAFIFIMLFDHYFWDIQQGQIMLWLALGLII